MSFLKEYTILAELGQGGFAKVYKVRHNELGYIRAIRVLNEPVTDEKSATYQKFLRECKVLLRLGNGSHPNIVHIYQPRLLESHALVEMDYVDGTDISHYLTENDRFLPADEVLRMVEQMSSALAYCHEDIYKFCMDREADQLRDDPMDGTKVLIDEATRQRLIKKYKVIHNDIHSGNIMRRGDGSFVLLDFGLAITGIDDVRNSSRHENGAVEFKAPEKWDNEALLTEQSDVYSFGVVMYEYLAGRVPFPFDKSIPNRTEATFKLSKAHKEMSPPPIFDLRKAFYEAKYPGEAYQKDYPDWLEEAIIRCLEKDPNRRFRNGKELHEFVKSHLKEPSPASDHVEREADLRRQISLLEQQLHSAQQIQEEEHHQESLLEPKPEPEHEAIAAPAAKRKKKRTWAWVLAIVLLLSALMIGVHYYISSFESSSLQTVEKQDIDSIKSFIQSYHQCFKTGDYEKIESMFAPHVDRYFSLINIDRQKVLEEMKGTTTNDRDVDWDYDWSTLSVEQMEDGKRKVVFSYDFRRNSGRGKGTYAITTEMILNSEGQIVSIYDSKSEKKAANDPPQSEPTPTTTNPKSEPTPASTYSKVGNDLVFTVNGVSFTMKYVEGGSFTMGAQKTNPSEPNYDSDADGDEKPVHSVTLGNYYMAETEVTQALWEAVMVSNPSNWKGDNLPVESVSWDDCQDFIRELNRMTGRNFRLPTEAEWEYAARGGNKTTGCKYAGSFSIEKVAWYGDNSGNKTHPVKTKQANELGLYDMSGNVWEWCQDWCGSYSSASQSNPTGPASGKSRVSRGGSWNFIERYCRVSNRGLLGPDSGEDNSGFRLVLPQ